jgi:uncharacterized protein YndB with AHSA1/START domain
MKDDLDRPADTRLMGIVHDALRRDLDRARAAISGPPFPADAQRAAIAEHLGWMTGFLHRHHESEDEGLYPLVRRRNPAAVSLLDTMDADHDRIGPAITGLTEAAAAYAGDPAAREGLGQALDRLADLLYPHLRREEDELMPVVSASITEAQWQEWDQKYNVKPLPPLELADTGLWILDDLGEADRAQVTGLVPPVPRWIITHLLAGRYRRAAYRRWRLAAHDRYKTPQRGQVEATTTASPEAVWAVLADVTRVSEWSHECRSVRWLGAGHGGPGARFRGRNKSGRMGWSRSCTVVTWEPSRELAYQTSGGAAFADSTEWRFTLTPADGGTVIRQSFQVLSLRVWADRVIWALIPAHHDRLAALRADLGRLAALAEADSRTEVKVTIKTQDETERAGQLLS